MGCKRDFFFQKCFFQFKKNIMILEVLEDKEILFGIIGDFEV